MNTTDKGLPDQHASTLRTMIHSRQDGEVCVCAECRAIAYAIDALSAASAGVEWSAIESVLTRARSSLGAAGGVGIAGAANSEIEQRVGTPLIDWITDELATLSQHPAAPSMECATCKGFGEIGGHVGQTAEQFDCVSEPCPDCAQPAAPSVSPAVEGGLPDSLDAFQDAMEAAHGYRPQVFATGVLMNSRDADRFEGWELARRLATAEQPGSAVQGEAVARHTEDHLTDKSATTYNPEVAERWRNKGWPVMAMFYTTPPPAPAAEQPEGVDEAMVERGLHAARDASDARLPRYSVVRAILTAALAGKEGK